MKKVFTLLAMVAFGFAAHSQVTVTYKVDVTAYIAAGNTLSPNGIRIGGNFGETAQLMQAGHHQTLPTR